jgi:hypothetical protein
MPTLWEQLSNAEMTDLLLVIVIFALFFLWVRRNGTPQVSNSISSVFHHSAAPLAPRARQGFLQPVTPNLRTPQSRAAYTCCRTQALGPAYYTGGVGAVVGVAAGALPGNVILSPPQPTTAIMSTTTKTNLIYYPNMAKRRGRLVAAQDVWIVSAYTMTWCR